MTVIDLSDVATENDRLQHFKVATLPAMIALITGMNQSDEVVIRDQMRTPGLLQTSVRLVQEATSVVLIPVTGRYSVLRPSRFIFPMKSGLWFPVWEADMWVDE